MPTPKATLETCQQTVAAVESALKRGFPPPGQVKPGMLGAIAEAARELGIPRKTVTGRLAPGAPIDRMGLRINWGLFQTSSARVPDDGPSVDPAKLRENVQASLRLGRKSLDELASSLTVPAGAVLESIEAIIASGVRVKRESGAVYSLHTEPPAASWTKGPATELVSRADNTFCFGAFGDLHAGSKYCRYDVREDLVRRAEKRGAQAIFDTGNYLDGHATFNRYDLEAVGMAQQTTMLAARHPKTVLPIYAVTGDDHEGWYSQREGIDIGWYTEKIMREAGHDWTDLGYMEAHVKLTNANTGAFSILAVVHPGGGSAYALSYRPQKIIESLEGGEKPAVLLLGHYHKLEAGNVRNVWYVQTGTSQDQTPFMRKKSIEAHVGGVIVNLEQDPRTGAILGMTPELVRFFNRDYHDVSRRWSHHGPVSKSPRTV